MTTIQGKTWKFGDDIDTDVIIPANRLLLPLDEMKAFAMAPIDPVFAANVTTGDIIVSGTNFGCGSSREQAPAVLKALGVQAIVARSFARIFFRNAINLGLPVIECDDIYDAVEPGDRLELSLEDGTIRLSRLNRSFRGSRLPDFLLAIIQAGGLIPHLSATRSDQQA